MTTSPSQIETEDILKIDRDKHIGDNSQPGVEDYAGTPDAGSIDDSAKSAGVVTVRCAINNFCPFVNSPKVEDIILLNDSTLDAKTLKTFPEGVQASIRTTSGMDGISLTPRCVYRHTYLGVKKRVLPQGVTLNEKTLVYPSEYIEWLPLPQNDDPKNTRPGYMSEQAFIIEENVFGVDYKRPSETRYGGSSSSSTSSSTDVTSCPPETSWAYDHVPRASEADVDDMINDYNKTYLVSKGAILSSDSPSVTYRPTNIMFPLQKSAQICTGLGTHWRAIKMTPMYRGEDFFVEFINGAPYDNLPVFITSSRPTFRTGLSKSFQSGGTTYDLYQCIDANINPATNRVTIPEAAENGLQEMKYPINYGVIFNGYDENGNVLPADDPMGPNKYFDFSDQVYYVIEMGYHCEGVQPMTQSGGNSSSTEKTYNQHYFLILCQRANPIFVSVDDHNVSWKIGEFQGGFSPVGKTQQQVPMSGADMINARWLRVSVRNHLGSLVITFEGPGFQSQPWVVTREDMKISGKQITSEKVDMFVPASPITIWAGNRLTGFLFGPMQFKGPITFEYPPTPPGYKDSTGGTAGSSSSTCTSDSTITEKDHFALPSPAPHQILLTATDEPPFTGTDPEFQYSSEPRVRLFTQDALVFVESTETVGNPILDSASGAWIINNRQSVQVTSQGSYFCKSPLKEPDHPFDSYSTTTDSKIELMKINGSVDKCNRSQWFTVKVTLQAGQHTFGRGLDYSRKWIVKNCKTPVMTMMRLRSDGHLIPRWGDVDSQMYTDPFYSDGSLMVQGEGFDASAHVVSFSENWGASDFTHIEHSGSIQFLLEKGAMSSNVGDKLLSLRDKTFYIEIWAGYTPGGNSPGAPFEGKCNYSRIPGLYKLFTGLCFGGTVEYAYGRRVMNCKLVDFAQVLKDQMIFNSPFYDGVKDVVAIFDIIKMAGFRYTSENIAGTGATAGTSLTPGDLIARYYERRNDQDATRYDLMGRRWYVYPYALPNSYAKLSQAQFRFEDASSYFDAIQKIASRSSAVFFFDQYGLFHYENYMDTIRDDLAGGTESVLFAPRFWFTSNPKQFKGQLIFNQIDVTYSVEDIKNHIKMVTMTPEYEMVFGDDLSWASIEDPSTTGFVGYLRTFYQEDGMLGGMENLMKMVEYYKNLMFSPPLVVHFETYGQPIRALDVVSVNGVPMWVTRVDTEIIADKNVWWQKFETERTSIPSITIT